MKRTSRILLVVLVIVIFLAVTTQGHYRGTISCSRDPVPSKGVWVWPTAVSDSDFHIGYGSAWDGVNANTEFSERGTVWTSDLTILGLHEERVAIPITAHTFNVIGSESGMVWAIDYGGVEDGNTKLSESGVRWASVLPIPSLPETQSANDLLRSSGERVMSRNAARAFDLVGSESGTTVVMTVGSPNESTLLHSGQRPDALGRMRQSASSLVCSAFVSDLCPIVGDLNHPRSSSSVTLNNVAAQEEDNGEHT
jgi:hypothetical protein